MKWLSGEPHLTELDTIDMLNQSSNGHENTVTPQLLRQTQSQDFQLSMGPGQDTSNQSLRSTQDEHVSMVGYMFPRDANDYVQATQHFINLKQQQRWALGDDSVSTDLSVDQQSPVPQQAGSTPQSAQGTTAQQQQLAAAQQVNAAAPQPMMFTQPIHPQLPPHLHQAIQFTQYRTNGAPPVTQIAPSAKKLWGVEEGKEDSHKTGGGGILNLNDQMWRDSTWSTSDHGVTQGMAMVPSARRPGATFPGTDNGAGVLSPRSSDSSGLGVKMVEYVLGTSPTSKDNGLEPRMRGLVLNSDGSDVKKEKDKAPASPYDVKKELVDASGAIQTNGMVPVVQNGIDNEDKYKYSSGPGGVVCYSRTPGSRQPSPTDDGSELAAVQAAVHHSHQASAAAHQAAQVQAHNQAQAQLHKAQQQQQQQQHGQQMHDVVIVQNHVGGAHSMLNHHGIPHLHQALPAPPPHPTHMSHIGDSVTQHFDHMMNMEAAGAGFESQYSGQGAPQQQPQQNTGAHAQPGMDSPNVLQPAFDVQVRALRNVTIDLSLSFFITIIIVIIMINNLLVSFSLFPSPPPSLFLPFSSFVSVIFGNWIVGKIKKSGGFNNAFFFFLEIPCIPPDQSGLNLRAHY